MSLIPVILNGGIQQCRCTPHPTLFHQYRVMILDKFDAQGEHELSRILPVKCVDGHEVWVLVFTKFEELNNGRNRAEVIHVWPAPVSKDALSASLERMKEGNGWLSPTHAYLCQCVGLVEEVEEAARVINERSAKRRQENAESDARQKAARDQARAEAYAKAKADFLAGNRIGVGHFEQMCAEYGVEMHIRTIGTLRKRISEIGTHSLIGDVRGAGMAGIYGAIHKLHRMMIAPPEPVEPVDHIVERLFARPTA